MAHKRGPCRVKNIWPMGQPGTARSAGLLSTTHKGLDRAMHSPQGPGKPLDQAASSSFAASTTSSAFSPPRSFPSSSYPSPSGVSPASSPFGSSSSPSPSSIVASSPAPSPSASWLPSSMYGPQSPAAPVSPLSSSSTASVAMPSGSGSAKSGRSPTLSTSTFPIWSSLVDPSRRRGSVRGVLAQCMAEAMRCLSVERYAMVGISYGGFVAFRMAETAEEVVEQVVILTVGISLTVEQRRELAGREERDTSKILLAQRTEDLIILLQRSMYRSPRWIPAFLLRRQRARHGPSPRGP